jgi:hypothetical protein
VNPLQFHAKHYYSQTTYRAAHVDPDQDTYVHPIADMTVEERPSREYPNFKEIGGYLHDANDAFSSDSLFTHVQGHHEVYSLRANKTLGARTAAMTLLGIAHERAKRAGAEFAAGDSLSPHSERLMQRGVERGVIPETSYHSNELGFSDYQPAASSKFDLGAPIPHHEVQAGRQAVRSFLKPPKKARTAPAVGQQLQFEGF